MLNTEAQIIDQLRHQWYVRGTITDEQMHQALKDLVDGKNPFLRKSLISELKKDPNFSIEGLETALLVNDKEDK